MSVDLIRGRYRIVREIARSNDIVYEAIDTTLGRRIALKELNIAPSLTGQARRDRIERFNREARAVGRLSHPNIVSVFDFGEENGRHFIAMEFLEGQSLRDMMTVRGAFPLKESLDITCQVLDALAYAHANRVIHRDIKPDNIQILPGGQVKLTDFGIARLTEEPALTVGGEVFGTPSYMSPEQIEGRSLDHRSDLFSLGVVLYEMLAGRKPFVGDSVISITYAIMHAEPASIPGVPTGIEQAVRRSLAKSPVQRFASAEEMKRDLRAAEQTPALFLPPTGMGQMPPGYGYPTGGVPGTPSYPPGAYGGYTAPQTMPGSVPPGGIPAQIDPQPWSWNNPGSTGANTIFVPIPQGMPVADAFAAYANPPYRVRSRDIPYLMTPAGRTFLLLVVLAAVIGGGIAFGVVGFMHSYDEYKVSVASQKVAGLIDQGAAEYNKAEQVSDLDSKAHHYRRAAQLFEQAMSLTPTDAQQRTLHHNLTATYIQLARLGEAEGQWQAVSDWYEKALAVAPDNQEAHLGRAAALERLGRTDEAAQERAAAQGGGSADTSSGQSAQNSSNSDEAFMEARRAHARDLIAEGDQLAQQGHLDDAREKWAEAMSYAPATPEHDEAQQRLQDYDPTNGNSGGQ
ncbi:MAG TPA: serine/threonine-protein kinase [Chthonomonadaceae bacterium]|nr:serine/threonine-protein kinase [Chthonomonadaceae bacterium]